MLNSVLEVGGFLRSLSFLGLSYLEWTGLVWTLIMIGYITPRVFSTIYCVWIAPALGHYANLRKMGKWAVITGASDGIGKAYAEEIARCGVNVVLISRTKSKLDSVAEDIRENFGVKTKTIAVDFTHGMSVYDTIQQELEGLEIGTLVNNIGIWYPFVDFFTELPNAKKHSQDMIHCNVCPVTFLTHMILPQMCSRHRGVIINVSSRLGTGVIPLAAMYNATKTFTERFSEALAMEYERNGIIIQTVIPAYVATRMSGVSQPSWITPSANEYVQMALKTVGVETRTAVHIPHRLSRLADELLFFFFRELDTRGKYHFYLTLRGLSKRRQDYKKIGKLE
ncbi:unnamed protein product [Allacma fusca]|uniref:Uncharacterized protein n=1 Tax=Allacma fusca TaxID=39272 RepID=A0A8J2M0N5_9HEXA|nr:unnamed protein product [Allacma fusca]